MKNTTISLRIQTATVAAATLLSLDAYAQSHQHPNIILFVVDDLGVTDLGCFGSSYYETPNIDRLAQSGMKFTNAYAACHVSSPTRAALLTGRAPARLGITDWIRAKFNRPPGQDIYSLPPMETIAGRSLQTPTNQYWLPLEEQTIAEMLKTKGYATAHIGKWHLGDEGFHPEQQGFDLNKGGCDLGQPPSYFDPFTAANGSIPSLPGRKKGEFLTDREADEAIAFIQSNANKPFFINYWSYAVHTPIMSNPEFAPLYEHKPKRKQGNADYATLVSSVDKAIGKLLRTLEETNLLNNTLIIFTSDNGGLVPITDNSPFRSGKGYPYEGGLRVPLIIAWGDRIKPNTTCSENVISTDFFPSFAQTVGSSYPQVVDGESIVDLWDGKKATTPRDLFWHFPHYRGKDVMPHSIVRSGNFKLIYNYDTRESELYNLKDDPKESTNQAADNPSKVAELKQKLDAWLTKTGAKMPLNARL